MKKYVLPTLVSLALSSSWVLAEETPAAAEPPASTPPASAEPAATQQHDSLMDHYQEMREKKTAYMQEMQALREKLREAAADPEEWQRLRDEMQRLTKEMRQQVQEMREKMRQEGGMMPGGPYGRSPNGRFGPQWGGPHYGPGPNYFNGPYGGPGWRQGGPHYNGMPYSNRGGMPNMPRPNYDMPYSNRGGMPNMPRPNYDMPYGNRGGMPDMPKPDFNMPYEERGGMQGDPSKGPGSFSFDKNRPLGHHAKMEQYLENIEKLLQQVVELLKNKE